VEKEFEMKDFSKNVLKDILKKDYKDIDFESIEQIDNIFNKVMQEKDN
jgi:hypothetical protein